MPAMQNNGGDVLARGGVRATFRPMGENVTREDWVKMFKGKSVPTVKAVYIFECPVHGLYASDREFVLAGDGYPKLNEYATGKCPQESCGETSKYAGFQNSDPGSGDASAPAGASSSKPRKARARKKAS